MTNAYDTFISQHPHANIYHTRAWLEVLAHTYGYQPKTLISYNESGDIQGVLPLMQVNGWLKGTRLVSLPFSHCVPLLATSSAIETDLLTQAIELTPQTTSSYLELKTRLPILDNRFQPSLLNHISELDLSPSLDALFEAFTPSNRRNIRKGEKAGFHIREGLTPSNLRAFYALEVATRQHQGSPIYPASFFPTLAQRLPNHLRLYLMSLAGQDVAGILLLNFGRISLYGYGAWVRDESLKRLYPMNLLVWHAIQSTKNEGYAVFDFGTTPLHNAGLLDFKQRYNPTVSPLPYWYYGQAAPAINREGRGVKLAEALLRRLPRPLFTRLTPYLLRELG